METLFTLVGIAMLMFAPWFGLMMLGIGLTLIFFGVNLFSVLLSLVWFYLYMYFKTKNEPVTETEKSWLDSI